MLRHILAATAIAAALAGCASPPPPTTSLDFRSRAVTRSDGGLRVSTAVLSARESEAVYDVPLAKTSIQPVWIEVEKAGVLFINPERVTRLLNIDLLQRKTPIPFSLFLRVPDDAGEKWFAEGLFQHHGSEIKDYDDLAELRAALERLPCCAVDARGMMHGDPLNAIFVGEFADIAAAFVRRNYRRATRPADASEHVFGRMPDAVVRKQSQGGAPATGPARFACTEDRRSSDLLSRTEEATKRLCGGHALLCRGGMAWLMIAAGCHALTACTSPPPLIGYSTDTPPLVLVPASQAGVQDQRARFREMFCAILDTRGSDLPDSRPCEEALTRVGSEPGGTGKPVDLGQSKRRLIGAVVAGVGYECFEQWLQAPGSVALHLRQFGYDLVQIKVDALSSSANNAGQIRDAIMAIPAEAGASRLVLIGYSKGAPDILEAMVTYPELRDRVAAVISAAGAIGGSALANDAEQYQADLLRHFPGATCDSGDGGAINSLRPATRRNWLAQNPLPPERTTIRW